MKREDLTKEEQIIADYGYVSGHEVGYRDGVNDCSNMMRQKKKEAYQDGILDGGLLTAAAIVGITGIAEWAIENEVANKVKTWCDDKWEKLKTKVRRKK